MTIDHHHSESQPCGMLLQSTKGEIIILLHLEGEIIHLLHFQTLLYYIFMLVHVS